MSRKDDAKVEAAREEAYLIENGLLEPGQPTLQAHRRYIERMSAPFSPEERRWIRYALLGERAPEFRRGG